MLNRILDPQSSTLKPILKLEGFLAQSQGHYLALTVFHVPCSFRSGPSTRVPNSESRIANPESRKQAANWVRAQLLGKARLSDPRTGYEPTPLALSLSLSLALQVPPSLAYTYSLPPSLVGRNATPPAPAYVTNPEGKTVYELCAILIRIQCCGQFELDHFSLTGIISVIVLRILVYLVIYDSG